MMTPQTQTCERCGRELDPVQFPWMPSGEERSPWCNICTDDGYDGDGETRQEWRRLRQRMRRRRWWKHARSGRDVFARWRVPDVGVVRANRARGTVALLVSDDIEDMSPAHGWMLGHLDLPESFRVRAQSGHRLVQFVWPADVNDVTRRMQELVAAGEAEAITPEKRGRPRKVGKPSTPKRPDDDPCYRWIATTPAGDAEFRVEKVADQWRQHQVTITWPALDVSTAAQWCAEYLGHTGSLSSCQRDGHPTVEVYWCVGDIEPVRARAAELVAAGVMREAT